MNVRLTPNLKHRVQRIAADSGLKVADLIRMAVEEYCEKVEKSGEVNIKMPPRKQGA
jgi:predicted DNA-binding protein